MCELFKVSINFKQMQLQNVKDWIENKEIYISLETDEENLVYVETNESIFLIDGCYEMRSKFSIESQNIVTNDDFMFKIFGQNITVKLSMLDNKDNEIIIFEKGYIKLLDLLQLCGKDDACEASLKLKFQDTILILKYEVKFENPPKVTSKFKIEILSLHHFENFEIDDIEACVRFPYNRNFYAAMLRKSHTANSYKNDSYLLDVTLKERNFEIDSNPTHIGFSYENYQQESGVKLFHNFIINQQKFLIELKLNSKMFMAFIDLDIFNYPGVHDVTFILPIYEWDSKIIRQQFQEEELYLTPLAKTSFSRLSKLIVTDDAILKELIIEGKHVAIEIRLKISKSVNMKISLESMLHEVNKIFPFIQEMKTKEEIFMNACEMDLVCIVRKIATRMENFIDANADLCEEKMFQELKLFFNKNLCMKNEFKETVETIIGNNYNLKTKTKTNHEFKIMLIDVFKKMSREIERILENRKRKELKACMNDNVEIWQIEEYIEKGDFQKAKENINHELNKNLDEMKLKERANFFLKIKDFSALEDVIRKLLRIDNCCSYAHYLLSYIFIERCDYNTAIMLLLILTTLKSNSIEYWIILSFLYEKIDYSCGVKFCELNIKSSKFIPNFSLTYSIKYPNIVCVNDLTKVIDSQLKLSLKGSNGIIKNYIEKNHIQFVSDDFKFLQIIEALEEKKYMEAKEILKTISITNDNEMTIRTLKGNILYGVGDTWKSICEYEILYNLCLENGQKFLHLPAIRCGLWYLHQMRNIEKAKKYFDYCCKTYSTFDSWIGLGNSFLISKEYESAEKCFNHANKIDNNSETWISLAFVNCKLQKCELALKCYLIAKKLGILQENERFIEVETFLNI
ncbi:hypothetical protein PVAND_004815 [Polypedilum vanderplanki]|uniref:Uncharacterized protein n=1 Tax=Polypedilum vanderplanki TaxID=319348 RepID=A0A9J6C077_POLVA|nr:hypothetical protein PVAND_004815 [Polypedilum vanderplanki]